MPDVEETSIKRLVFRGDTQQSDFDAATTT